MGAETPERLDLTHEPPLLTLGQWGRFCNAYAHLTNNEFHFSEKTTYILAKVGHPVAVTQWAAWQRWVAVYKLTGDGRGSFAARESRSDQTVDP